MTGPRQLGLFDAPSALVGENPLDHHKRFGVSAEEHVAALEWLSDSDDEFAELEDRQAEREEAGDTAGASAVQEQLDAKVREYLAATRPRRTVKHPAPDPPPERLGDDDDEQEQFDPAHERVCREFEKFLRDKGWPYVAVDEAKTAIFGNAKIGAFDFLLYSSAGANLLVMLRADEGPVGAEPLATMKEWQKTFGEGFEACFACGTRAVTLAEYGRTGWANAQEISLLV